MLDKARRQVSDTHDSTPHRGLAAATTHRHRSCGLQPLRRYCTMASLVSGPWEAVCCGTFDATTPDDQRRSLWRRGTVNEPKMTKDIALTAAPSR
jgi:hypothetical protein